MSYNNFGRGRGFGQRGTRPFGRPRFPRPPYRHAGPPRPAHSMSFGMPWQPNNMLFQPHLRGNPQFRPDGRRKRFNSYDIRFPAPNRPPAPLGFEEVIPLSSSPQVENNQIDVVPQLPLLGSEEERQQKITETADRLKQKLSCITNDKMTDTYQNDDIPVPSIEDNYTEERPISVLGYEPSELNLTYNDLKDIEKINSDNLMQDDMQFTTDVFDVTINTNSDVILEENEAGSQIEVISNNQIPNMENLPDNNDYMEVNKWEFQESIDNSQNLEQLDFHRDNNIESELLESDQCQYDIPLANISQDQYDQEQDISQGNEIHPIPVIEGQDIFETSHLQNIADFPADSANQDIIQKDMSQIEEEPIANLEVQEDVLNSHVYAQSSSNNNCMSSQPVLASTPVLNNSSLDNQLPRTQENSFPGGPPKLSPHTEQELPIDFDPTTPPPILLKQEQPQALPPFPIPDLPPLFDPTEPPPNMRNLHGINIPHDSANAVWNPVSAAYNTEVHTELSMHGGFISQQLPLGMSSQGNVFLSPSIDAINFSPVYAVPPSNHPGVATNIPSALPQIHAVSCNTYVPSSPSIELSPSSDVHYSMSIVNKDEYGLDEMQEAMKFAKQMANITEKKDEGSKPNSKSLSESCTSVNPINNIESISLPPGKPKTKTNKSKRTKQDDTYKKKISEKQRTSDNPLSEEAMVQDANIRSTDASIMSEQDRPKVVFNLNNKTIKVSSKNTWQETNEKRNGMTQSVESEKTYVTSPVTKKNLENPLKRNEEGEKNLRKNENSSEITVSSESIAKQSPSSHKKIQKGSHTERSQRSTVSLPKVNAQKLKDRTEKNESSNSEASWKNKIISRFLKMSKNDIYNMVNNTSLRKFDVIMKRLVKEKKSTLSLEMRHAQDEKIKLYDQQEFMKQLNQMLDTEATVSITDLPTEFIHHLNEVLQLDVQPDNHPEFAVASTSQSSHSEDTSHVLNTMTRIMECANKTLNDVNQECVKSKSNVTKRGYDKDIQDTHNTKNNDFNLKDRKEDTCNTIVSNKSSTSGKLSTLQLDLDDILSEVTKKNQDPVIVREHKDYSVEQMKYKYIDDAALKNIEKEVPLEDNRINKSEICTRWNEKCDRWKRKEREDPHAYRNLTKEEWEARYGTQANPIPSSSGMMKKSIVSDKNPSENVRKGHGKKFCTRRRYSSESSKHTNIRHRTLEKDKHNESRRHSDDRKHSVEYSECINVHNNNSDSNSTNSSSSSSTSTSSSSSSSSDSDSAEPNVTKLLRVIKENEKVAKKMSLSETIRDEVNAEIERERKQKSKKSRKNRRSAKCRRERKVHHKKRKKQSKKATSSSESSNKDKNEEVNQLLTENEIKKEIIENQIMQEVIVKEELDIGQEENIGEDIGFESGNSNHAVIENKAMYLLSESCGKGSPLAQETPLTTVNAIQLHVEDRPPITSPTQPKTKAQLKQMPETADMNDNKVPLNVFTTIPEDWNIINLTNISECTENLNKSYQTTDISCNQDKTEVLSAGTSQDAIDNTVHVPCGKSNEIAQQIDATICPTESSNSTTKIQDDNEISVAVNVSDKASTVTASASCQASDNPNTATQKQSTSKKIDIKTYYERTIQRRKKEQREATKSVESSTVSTQDLFKSKNTEVESTINKSVPISVYNSSIQDPRLAARSAATLSSTNSENVIAQTTSRQNVQQEEKKMIKKSKVTELTSKYPEEDSNPINTDSAVKIITQDKPKNKIASSNIKILSDVTITPKSASSRSKKSSEIEATDKKSQSRVSPNCKKFKNIRSEGSKELKLKKEMTNVKTKKKSTTASKSANLVSTKVYHLAETTRAKSTDEIIEKKETDNVGDISKTKTERTAKLVSFYEDKIDNTNMKIESTISSENIDNSSALHDIDKAKECSLKSEFIDCKNTKETIGNIENTDVREHSLLSSGTMRNEETCNIKHQNDMSNVEIVNKESQSARETSNTASGLDVSIASKITPKSSSYVEKINKEDLFTSNTIEDTEFMLNFTKIQIEKSNNTKNTNDPIPIEERGVSNVPELNTISRLDDIDNQGKGDKQLINKCAISNVEINDTKENNIKPDMLDGMYKPADADEENSSAGKTAEVSSASNENSQEQQGIENNVTSPGSTGSPFKGFLQETMMEFEQPNLFNLELGEIDADKKNKLFLDDCNVNCVIHIDNGKEKINIERQQKYETIEPVINYMNNDVNINNNGNFNVTFGDTLLASDKECTTSEKSDKSDLMADESREGYVKKSSNEVVTTTLRDEDNNANISEGSETEKQLIDEERYSAELAIKESMFINEEEMIHGEIQSKDLINKLTTTTDPSLSDALDAANSDDAGDTLRLPENQSTEHLNNSIYLETNISAEKTSCIKLSGFDSDEHLDNDMFYFERLQSFDDKDDESAHFSIHPSPPDNITPAITPETTIITPCADLSHDEIQKPDERKFDFKHISSTNNDLLVEPSVERSPTIIDTPRTLNVPTKAALKEAATSLFLKSPGNISTAAKETAVEISEKAQQNETDQCYQTPMWHADIHNTKTYPLETHTNTPVAQDFINVNTISSTQNSTSDERTHKNTNANQSKYSTSSANMEKLLHVNMQRNPVVELKKMKELDKMVKKKIQEDSEKMKDNVYKVPKKRNGTLLHKLKDKRQMKYRTKKTLNRNSLVKKLKHMKRSEKVAGNTRESILARMLEIDIEMYKLTKEKLKLHEILQSNSLPTENPATNSSIVPREDDIPEKSEMPLTLMSHLMQDVEVNRTKQVKQVSPPKQSPIKQRKRIASHNSHSEDCEITNYTQRTKMPVIRWKKKPRLEEVVRREEDEEDNEEEEDEENLDKRTEQETSTITADKKANDSADVSEGVQKLYKVCHVRIQQTTSQTNTKIDCNVDKSSKRTTCSDKIATEKNTDSEWQNSTRRETERVENSDNDKRNDILVNEIPKTNFQASEIPKTNSQASEIPKTNFQPPNAQVGNTPEPLSIYSDDSTWDSLVQNTASEMHENRKVTGLVLLDETLKKELARTRKMKSIVRKKKKKQLDNFLKVVNNLTMEEEELPLSKLYIKKLQQKRDLLDSLSQGKEELSATVDSKVLQNVDEVINAVAENRVKDLYDPQMEARASNDIPTTSKVSSVSQPDKHQLLVDAEANANSDWPCREKENVEEVAVQQESNDMPSVDESNHVFKAVNEVSFYDERNVEPDSSITPEETLMENRPSDCAPPKDPDNTVSRNFDIKVSVPKTLIKEDISIGLLQKCKEPESGVVDTELVDSTTKIFSTNTENLRENDKNPQNNLQTAKSIAEKDKGEKKSETEDKHVADASGKEEATDSMKNTQSMPQSSTVKPGYSDATENEDSGDSVASNDKIITTDITRESSISDSIIENIDTKQKKLSIQSEQLSNDVIALKQDYQNVENMTAKEDERSNSESKPRVFEEILDNENSGSLILASDRASEKSEESNEMSIEHKSSSEYMSTSILPLNKVKGGETNKKMRRKQSNSMPVRRSTRYINENVKPNKINETDGNSNSSEQESSVHERDLIIQCRSKSPTSETYDEKTMSNVKKNRTAPKVQNVNRKVGESETKIENPVKPHLLATTESTASKSKVVVIARKRKQHTKWQMMNCKVRLIDCKSLLAKDINFEILENLGIITTHPIISDISCVQRTTHDRDTVITSAASSDKSPLLSDKLCDKEKSEIQILEEKPIKEKSDSDLPQGSTSQVNEIEEQESVRTLYTVHKGPILDIKVFENSFLAASEDGKIYRYSQTSNGILNIYTGHKSAVTCLNIYKSDVASVNKELMYSGSLDGTLCCFNINTGALIKSPVQINSPIQCMDQAWTMIFIGTKSGHVSRFHIKTGVIKGGSIKFSDKSVLALKATNEGPRRILIVASRNQPITIRDAQTGLFLRTISGQKNHTVYSLMRHHNLIYCGTSSTSINVFDFMMGDQIIRYDAGVGIVCMRLYEQLLFAGCYDGNIYVFDTRTHKLVCSIRGPGNMLLSIEVVNNKIIAGSKDKSLQSWHMPTQVRALL